MTGFYLASVTCDYRSWAREQCDEAMTCADGQEPPTMGAVRRIAHASGWVIRYGPGRHGYDLCPEHAQRVPRVTFPDWRNPRADHAADQAAAVARSVAAFGQEMTEQGIHVGLGSPARCVVCDVPYPCAAASPESSPPCLTDDSATGH